MGDTERGGEKKTFLEKSIFVALIGVAGLVAASLVQGWMDIRLQENKFQSELILRVIDEKNREEQVKYLKFIRDLGLIPRYADRIEAIIEKPERIPSLIELSAHIKATSSISDVKVGVQPGQP